MTTSRPAIKKEINTALRITTAGLHSDDYWSPVGSAWKAIDALGHEVVITSAEYTKDSNGCPDSKIWKFEVYIKTNVGMTKPLYGVLTAHGAGTTEDPLCKYDISAYVS